jgi:hypothetical protein
MTLSRRKLIVGAGLGAAAVAGTGGGLIAWRRHQASRLGWHCRRPRPAHPTCC